ncbi:TIGR03087 family PEP-CTERM/XrtA system glycosyltransferase [Paraglaciecola sp. T6c]|uniref:TIGR03087 family PEP-CTERM/XrtA system glycosyltransferase n=1 Tax=Pseudoalteromonas atlantica (strain T6c / ATCC BAA-1087) TaxID=3042615 RepID=UPI00030E693D
MKILYLSHRVPFPPNKGEKIRTFHQIEYLLQKGHEVTVISPYEQCDELPYFTELKSQYGVNVHSFRLPPKLLRLMSGFVQGKALSVANFSSAELQKGLDQLLDEHDFSALVCTASSMAEYIFNSQAKVIKDRELRLFMDFMDLDSDKWRQYAQRSSLPMKLLYSREKNLISALEVQVASHFNTCFFITETEVALFKQGAPDLGDICAIENGIDTVGFCPPDVPRFRESPILLFTGVMNYSPNVDAVLWFVENVWKDIVQIWPSAEFVVAGMDPTEKIIALGNMRGITVTGFVDDIKPYFNRANVFVAPFRIARGVQNKVLQAFACGLPVISTPMGAEGIRCTENKDILLAETSSDFILQLEKLFQSPERYARIAENALQLIQQHYTWESILAPFENKLLINQTELISTSQTNK